jgi:hypothetical protein
MKAMVEYHACPAWGTGVIYHREFGFFGGGLFTACYEPARCPINSLQGKAIWCINVTSFENP